ncbi:hypothetical protein [Mesobacillus maritimus]|nr:hypothetical protein [Mesobacillus maritimus]
MVKAYTDIDELLEKTTQIAEEAPEIILSHVEIDRLLELTSDWSQ